MKEVPPPQGQLPPDLGGTIVQAGDALAAARALSDQATVGPAGAAATAPRIPGYTLAEMLGRGSFATAWKAVQARTGKTVAVKVFHQSSGVNWLFLRREVERLVRLDKHPHVVSLLDADLAADPPYYVTDLMEGGSLERFVDPAKPVEAATVARWLDEIAQALAFVHGKGIIHCDLKPANVLLDGEGRIRVADFGQARVLAEGQGALGTLFYMAPEQARLGDEGEAIQPDVRWDLYALGATAYALLTGNAPYADTLTGRLESSSSVAERLKVYRELSTLKPVLKLDAITGLDEDLAAIVGKCLIPGPTHRYESAGAILSDLAARRNHRPVSPLAHRRRYRVKRYLQRNRIPVAVAGILLAGLVAVSGLLVKKHIALAEQENLLRHQLASSYNQRGRQFADRGDAAMATVYFAEANRVVPSFLSRACAQGYLRDVARPAMCVAAGIPVFDAAFSPDGTAILAGAGGAWGAKLWDVKTGKQIGHRLRHTGATNVTAVAFSPDGRLALTAGVDSRKANGTAGAVRIWNALTGKEEDQPLWHDSFIESLGLSADGRRAISGSNDGVARVWELKSRREVTRYKQHGAIMSVALSPDGARALSGSNEGAALWNAANGKLIRLLGRPGPATAVAFTPDGTIAVTGGTDATVRMWDGRTGRPLGKTMVHQGPVTSLAFSPDGKTVVTGSEDSTARVWKVPSGEPAGVIVTQDAAVRVVAFSPLGGNFLSAGDDRTIRVWNAVTGEPEGAAMHHEGFVHTARFSPDGRFIVSGGFDNTVRVWDLGGGHASAPAVVRNPGLAGSSLSPDGKRLLTWGNDGTARMWSASDGKPDGNPIVAGGPSSPVRAAAFSADGTRLAIGCGPGATAVGIFDARTGTTTKPWLSHDAPVVGVVFSPDGRYLATFTDSGGVRIWDLATRKVTSHDIKRGGGVSGGVFFSGDGHILGTLGVDGDVVLYRAPGGEEAGRMSGMSIGRSAVAFVPGSSRLVTGGWNWSLTCWRFGTKTETEKFVPSWGIVESVDVSHDGRLVAAGMDENHAAKIWELGTGHQVGKDMVHQEPVTSVALSPDGRTLLTGSKDATARLWEVASGEPIGLACRGAGPVSRVEWSPDGQTAVVESLAAGSVQLVDTKWLQEDISSKALVSRVGNVSHFEISADGSAAAIPASRWLGGKKEQWTWEGIPAVILVTRKMVRIDGGLADFMVAPALEVRPDSPEKVVWGNPEDVQGVVARFHFLYDRENIYIGCEVKKGGPPRNNSDVTPWDGDAIEVCWAVSEVELPANGSWNVIVLAPTSHSGKPIQSAGFGLIPLKGIRLAAKPGTDGYTLTAAIPIANFKKFDWKPGKKVRLECAVHVAGPDGIRKGKYCWQGTDDASGSKPDEWGLAEIR